jgi:hypothetical protein
LLKPTSEVVRQIAGATGPMIVRAMCPTAYLCALADMDHVVLSHALRNFDNTHYHDYATDGQEQPRSRGYVPKLNRLISGRELHLDNRPQ